jgi:hypothetical protein
MGTVVQLLLMQATSKPFWLAYATEPTSLLLHGVFCHDPPRHAERLGGDATKATSPWMLELHLGNADVDPAVSPIV